MQTNTKIVHIHSVSDFVTEYRRLQQLVSQSTDDETTTITTTTTMTMTTTATTITSNSSSSDGDENDSSTIVEYRVSEKLIGRICKAREHLPEEKETLSSTSEDRTCYFMGSDGLAKMLAIGPGKPFEMLKAIGHEQRLVDWRLSQGYSYELIVLDGESGSSEDVGYLATWSGLFKMCSIAFPDVYHHIRHHEQELVSKDFSHFEEQFDFFKVKTEGESSPHYLNYNRFQQQYLMSSQDAQREDSDGRTDNVESGDITPLDARKFFYFEMGVTDLFDGEGYTKNEDGELVFKEFLYRNRRRHEISNDHAFLSLIKTPIIE